MVQSYKNESKSQRFCKSSVFTPGCDVWYKVTKMRANHNKTKEVLFNVKAVMYGTKLQKWEQITTSYQVIKIRDKLWCMVQSYKNESKSQPYQSNFSKSVSCDVWYKVTKMRANHNMMVMRYFLLKLWCMVQSYKNESKSQPSFFASQIAR